MRKWNSGQVWLGRLDHVTRRAAVDEPPTMGTPVDAPTASAVLDLALRVSELALASGSSAADATAYALTVAEAYGLKVDVDVTWTSITICYHRAGAWEPITGFRSVRDRDNDYRMLAALTRFVDEVAGGQVRLVDARDAFKALRGRSRSYRSWVVAMANGGLGASVAVMLGGPSIEAALAGVAMVLLHYAQLALARLGTAPFYQQVAGAAVPTVMAVAVMGLRDAELAFTETSPSLIVAAGMVSLLAGLGVVTAARDALEGNLITSAARTFDTLLKTGGIVFGVVIVLWLAQRVGLEGSISPTGSYIQSDWWQVLAACASTIFFAITCHVSPRSLLRSGGLGAAGYATYFVLMPVFGNYPAAATAGAFVVGMLSQLLSRRWRVPVLALITTGVVSLMPGMMLYRGLYYFINNAHDASTVLAPTLLLDSALTGIGLAAGSMLGAQLARPFTRINFGWRFEVERD